ncbi:islet cell autoantigen 1 [Topomyia yanbarensis]|uniref:islet cell autoantigen 1 n=1 Tax=Topomyia yanbarensis TaxID=2498891 RepID=UPI00273CCC71|nr:islet cell autoantigen 1 [Topomyia yanbarensis]
MLKSEFQHQFWVTKKAVQRKLGTKEDENIVASDGELDSKIELFQSVADSSRQLYRIIDQYQERVCILAQEENTLGKFLREVGKESPTTGKLMSNTGKAVSYCGQQRITIRVPLLRLHHDVQTFKGRAIVDTQNTIQAMEKERTEYRAALSWMKSVSIQLDPDTGRGLEKFRKAQHHVKTAKTKFDKYTLDCLEKIDLLAAARCNMFSHALVGYQNAMLQFAKKSSDTYKTALKSLSKEPHYNFSILRELTQANPNVKQGESEDQTDKPVDDDQMLFFQDDFKDEQATGKEKTKSEPKAKGEDQILSKNTSQFEDLLAGITEQKLMDTEKANSRTGDSSSSADLLGLTVGDEFSDFLSAPVPFLPSTLLTNPEAMQFSLDQLSSPRQSTVTSNKPASNDVFGSLLQSLSKNQQPHAGAVMANNQTDSKRPQKDTKDLSGWYQLFAELDPLSNPDAIPSKSDAPHNSLAA